MRGFLCLAVVDGHAYGHVTGQTRAAVASFVRFGTASFEFLISGTAPAAVWGFFILSGYLIGKGFLSGRYTLHREGIVAFYRNRLLRILPLYYVVLAACCFFGSTGVYAATHAEHHTVTALILFFANLIGPITIASAGVFWSLSTEMQFYTFAPLLARAIRIIDRIDQVAAVLMFALLISVAWRFVAWQHDADNTNWIYDVFFPIWSNAEFFIVGMLCNGIVRHFKQWERNTRRLKIVGYICFAIFYVASSYLTQVFWPKGAALRGIFMVFSPAIAMLSIGAAIVAFELSRVSKTPKVTSISSHFQAISKNPLRVFELIGTLTYGIYLWHMLFLDKITPTIMGRFDGHASGFVLVLVSVLAVSTMIALITYQFVEYPFEAMKTFSAADKVSILKEEGAA